MQETDTVPVVCAVDAKKNRFYNRVELNGKIIVEDGDFEVEAIKEKLKQINSDTFFVCGSDAKLFIERLKALNFNKKLFCMNSISNETENLFKIAEEMIAKKIPSLKDFEGPVYIRASEAEEKLTLKASS